MSNFEVSYPKQIPLEAGEQVLRIVRARSFVEERALLGEAVWNVQGYAQKTLLGEGTNVIGDEPEIVIDNEDDCCAALEIFGTQPVQGAEPKKAIPWALVFAAVKFLLEKYLNR